MDRTTSSPGVSCSIKRSSEPLTDSFAARWQVLQAARPTSVSYTHLRAHETGRNLVCRLLLEKKISFERLEKIQNVLFENQIQMNNSLKGKVIDVLVENLTDDKSKAFGRSEYMTSVIFNGKKNDIGKIVQVRIKDSNRNTLFGEAITNSDQKVA